MDRLCKGCGGIFQIEEFATAGIVKGVKYFRHQCTSCYSKQKIVERKTLQIKFEEYKKTLKCEHCNNNDFRVLEFHHIDPSTKDDHVSQMVMNKCSWENVLKEIAKCLCLCANCHRIVHFKEKVL